MAAGTRKRSQMTNPNPVAPKTDTPATQIPDGVTGEEIKAQVLLILEDIESRFEEDGEAACAQLCLDLATERATLAAERASRLQADTEQFNAGIEAAADYANGFGCLMEIIPGETKADHLQRFMKRLVAAIRTQSKPSVSPEQEK